MRIGVPTEVKDNEFRVAITPAGVHALTRRGHTVTIQAGAGEGASIPDAEYTAAGAVMTDDVPGLWADSELILKVKEPIAQEYPFLHPDLLLFTYLHLAAERALTEELLTKRVTSIAYETVETPVLFPSWPPCRRSPAAWPPRSARRPCCAPTAGPASCWAVPPGCGAETSSSWVEAPPD